MRYPVSVFECWLLVWVLLDTTTLNLCSAACTKPWRGEHGDIRVSKKNAVAAAGRIWVCDETQWRGVCHDEWDLRDAKVVCQQLELDPEGAVHCRNSCFGRSTNFEVFTNVTCTGTEARLADCNVGRTEIRTCPYAGVICRNPQPSQDDCACSETSQTTPPDCPTSPQATPPDCPTFPQATPPDCPTSSQATPTDCPTFPQATPPDCTTSPQATPPDCSTCPQTTPPICPETTLLDCKFLTNTTEAQLSTPHPVAQVTAIGGALGALAAGLGLALVGVVMGWVWHCHRHQYHHQQYNIQRNISGASLTSNPSYHLPKPHPSIQYSSQGPRDTPLNTSLTETSFATYEVVGSPTHTKSGPAPLEERVYQVLEGPGEGRKEGEGPDYQEEGEYHVLGDVEVGKKTGLTYEVPIPTATLEQAKKQADTHYSSLQHH